MRRPAPIPPRKPASARPAPDPRVRARLAALFQQGLSLHRQGQLDEAGRAYQAVLKVDPRHFDALHLSGVVAYQRGEPARAIQLIDQAIAIDPNRAPAHNNRGNALKALARIDEALVGYEAAIRLKPDYPEALNNRGNALKSLGQLGAALQSYDQALASKPDFAEVWCNRGLTLRELGRLEQALDSYDQALCLRPADADAHYQRGVVLQEMFRLDEAAASHTKALEFSPGHGRARWVLPFLPVMRLFHTADDLEAARDALRRDLDRLDQAFAPDRLERALEAVGSCQPFYLAYQEVDNRPVLARYGEICHRLMSHWQARAGIWPAQGRRSGPIRVGIVGEQIRHHSVWNAITRGWVLNLEKRRFTLHVFHLGSIEDDETRLARAHAASFTDRCPSLLDWARAIADSELDVLIYPEIGMHQLTAQLASLRLAPVQMAAWGHPETTGLPSIDHYLSAELFEPGDAQRLYTEQLLALPNLGCCYSRLQVAASKPDLHALGLDGDAPILLCPGKPFKYAPGHDPMLVAIARELGRCRLVFFVQDKAWASLLRQRLSRAFEQGGLRAEDHLVFVPWLSASDFYGLMGHADVFLDTLGFSGFNTAMQAIDCALPIVTREGRFMRGRLASGVLRRMGLHELVADSENGYVDLAVRLVRDQPYRDEIRREIIRRREVLYDDVEPVRALERFLIAQCRGPEATDAGGVPLADS